MNNQLIVSTRVKTTFRLRIITKHPMPCPGLKKINFVLALAGHQISPRKKWQQIMRPILFLFAILRMVTVLITDLMRFATYDKITMFHVSDTLFTASTIMFHLSAGLKQSSISRFITKHESLMTHEHKDRLEVVGKRNLAFYCLFFVTQYLISICCKEPFGACDWKAGHIFMSSHGITLPQAIVINAAFVYECLVYQCWMAMSFCLYNYCLTVKQEAIHCKLNHVYFSIMNRDPGSSRHLSIVIKFMQTIQGDFDACFSIFPFLVFATNFMQTSGYLLFMLNASNKDIMFKIGQVMFSLSLLTVSLLLSSTAHSQENKEVAERIHQILDKPCMTAYDSGIINSIDKIVDRSESAWLFELDKRMVLPFFGHVISFSVLFMQLMPSKGS